ncbi:hypothetical protein Cni_G18817 [Canna indica]|uniref:Uncharacterized protein n=1 Tax=Canna indica TaxID=4628 RepID=A0AAQ3QI23_9LILI|nr:hypothetical protein Cni_G18817 [Canna indica]
MSRVHDVLRITKCNFSGYFPVTAHKGSSRFLNIEHDFEQKLAEGMRKLQPIKITDVFSLQWIIKAIQSTLEAHTNIKTLVTELHLPVSDWDEKCIDIYLDSSVKVLDICNIFSAEINRLNQGQLLLRYVLHILDTSNSFPSSERLRRARVSLDDWLKKTNSRSTKLDSCHAILQTLKTTICLPKAKTSAKGRVLKRALYGVGVMTLFTCSVILAALTGSSIPLIDLHISDKFLWLESFHSLQAFLHEGIRREHSNGKLSMLKEMEAFRLSALMFHSLTNGIDSKEEPGELNTELSKDGSSSQWKYANPEEKERTQECIKLLTNGGQLLGNQLDSFSKQVNDLFQVLLNGRDALLCNLRASNISKRNEVKM